MPDLDRRMMIAGASLIGAAALARAARAGQLDPPAGGITPTGRSLRDVEPRFPININTASPSVLAVFTITQPGAYVLTEPMSVPAGKSGIVIETDGPVSIDLRGFAITGSPGAISAIRCPSTQCRYVEVYDGYISDFDGDGIDSGEAEMLDLDDLHISRCQAGVYCRKNGSIVSCNFRSCSSHGFVWDSKPDLPGTSASRFCEVDDCEFMECGGHGALFSVTDMSPTSSAVCSMCDCDCVGNNLDGVSVSVAATGSNPPSLSCQIESTCATGNKRFGIDGEAPVSPLGISGRLVIECCDCVCTSNSSHGMSLSGAQVSLEDIDCIDNGGSGLVCDTVTGSIECCQCSSNVLHGMVATNVQGAIEEVDCRRNGADGMVCATLTGSVEDCEFSHNTGAGLRYTADSSICTCARCHFVSNGAEGMFADATCNGLTVTDSEARSNAVGIRVDSSNNVLLWNMCSGNGLNYQLDPAMPVVVIAPSDMPSNTNPHANYSL